jgi:uncharacterized membrane-anchored protein
MNKKTILILFAIVAVAQLAIPAKMVLERELTLSSGETFKFRTAPVDPYDAFRGRYVSLQTEVERQAIPLESKAKIKPGSRIYVTLSKDGQGFAKAESVGTEPPTEGSYVTAPLRSISGGRARVDFPLDRYYLPEDLAPRAERAYFEHSRGGKRDAYILVRVRSGEAVIEDLYVGGMPIRDFLDQHSR